MSEVAVIGLGQMGATLARLLLNKKHQVHVWNRTPSKAQPLVELGAGLAGSAAAAIRASRVVVMCVHDYAGADDILQGEGVAAALDGRLLIQLTTGSPQDARDAHDRAAALGAAYLDGAIQVAPDQMGSPDTTILVSGAQAAFDRGREVLAVFGGNIVYLGEKAAAAATMDMATLSYVYGAILGFVHGARVIEAEGLSMQAYGDTVAAMSPSYGQFLRHQAAVIDSGDFSVSQSPLSISVEATRRLERMARESGLDARVPALAARFFRQAADAGYAQEELAALIKVMR